MTITVPTSKLPVPPVLNPVFNDQGEQNDAERFIVPATSSFAFPVNTWHKLYSQRITSKQNGSVKLPTNWRGVLVSALEKTFPYCYINFKRHKLYKVEESNFRKKNIFFSEFLFSKFSRKGIF